MDLIKENNQNEYLPEYLFEVSWEICNKVGGIYTVISTKYSALLSALGRSQIIMIGPDILKETPEHPDFEEDIQLLKNWRETAALDGIYFRVGWWRIPGRPMVILVDFTSFFPKKDEIFARYWEDYGLDSINGQWDYVEPAMFGYAAARVIESFYRSNLTNRDRVLAHFHEWMTGSGVLFLKKHTPGIAVAFTTHATVLGRSLAGNGRPLYSSLTSAVPDAIAGEFQVKSKFSLEKLAADNCDLFTTVSNITSVECQYLLGKNPDAITPNGFDSNLFVPENDLLETNRNVAREKILKVAEAMFNTEFNNNTLLVLTSGRYEFRNKGLDIFIDALGELSISGSKNRMVLAVIAVPSYHHGPRLDLIQRVSGADIQGNGIHTALTHMLHQPENDQVLRKINNQVNINKPDGNVFVMFVPTYLNGNDGIFNLSYYDFLCGFNLTIFPSYYEPWGYTPLESVAFGIPAVTTSLAGFGVWVKDTVKYRGKAVQVIERNDLNDNDVIDNIKTIFNFFINSDEVDYSTLRKEAIEIAEKAQWKYFIRHYIDGYKSAMQKANDRALFDPYNISVSRKPAFRREIQQPLWNKILVKAAYPKKLEKLHKLTENLWWTWNYDASELFESINPQKWQASGNNPARMISMLEVNELKQLSEDDIFIQKLEQVWNNFERYVQVPVNEDDPSIAYFSMEYGLHESLKIYSGGLGILAGDYLKEASDCNKNITGVGLLYRYGYFNQHLTPLGDQIARYIPQKFSDLPIIPLRDEKGEWIMVSIALPGRNLFAKAWQVRIGRVTLYLLDTDFELNGPHDRVVTHHLYGGDLENRLKQEILLGIGGIRLLKKLGINPDVYHCNEGHAAFISFERIREIMQRDFLSFDEAMEVVRSSTLFTTHTPVPAGHDRFPEDLLRAYISHYPDRFHISWNDLMSLGFENPSQNGGQFSMSVLAIKMSQEVNGVSRIHGEVSRKMFSDLFPGYFPEEIHIGYVTNGVHYPTWAHHLWKKIHGSFISSPDFSDQHIQSAWEGINHIDDSVLWETRNELRTQLLNYLRKRLAVEMAKRQDPPGHIVSVLESLEDPILTVGFARRFATYKRAHLLFSNEERLLKLVTNRKHPIRFIFAGKAHPNDKAGQDLIKRIIEISHRPQFEGKIIFTANYDMELGRLLTQGCDIWLNTPTRPLEASGTSGEKAAMNGVLNLSVLDGWWAEGYKPEAGWALDQERVYQESEMQDLLDAETIYNLLEEKIAPLFYERNSDDIPEGWLAYIRNNFRLITPNFTMRRMLSDYYRLFYHKLKERSALLSADRSKNARFFAAWKRRIMLHWENITLLDKQLHLPTAKPLNLDEPFRASIILHTPGLGPDDLKLEVIFGEKTNDIVERIFFKQKLTVVSEGNGKLRFDCDVAIPRAGVFDYSFRLTPDHPLMPYPMDFPLMKWL